MTLSMYLQRWGNSKAARVGKAKDPRDCKDVMCLSLQSLGPWLPSLQHLPAAPLRPFPVRQGQPLEEGQRLLPAARQQGEHLAELVFGAVAVAQAQEAVGEEDAHLEEGGIEVERGAVGAHRVLRTAAEVVKESFEGVGGRL